MTMKTRSSIRDDQMQKMNDYSSEGQEGIKNEKYDDDDVDVYWEEEVDRDIHIYMYVFICMCI
jgi:hypothetical protein